MAKIDPADLLNSREVAALIGVSSVQAVAVYRSRYEDFPVPIVEKHPCVLWARSDVAAWVKSRASRTS